MRNYLREENIMLLTIFLAIVCCGAVTLMLVSAIAFIQDNRFFSSAPKEALAVIKQRDKELLKSLSLFDYIYALNSHVFRELTDYSSPLKSLLYLKY